MHEWGLAQQPGKDWVSRTMAWPQLAWESQGWSPARGRTLLSLTAGCCGLGWAGCHSSPAALTCPFLNLVLSWRSALLWISRGHFSSVDHFPRLKNSADMDWNVMHSVASCASTGPWAARGCALAGWCFTASAASVRDGYLYVPAPANPQEMPLGPSLSVLHLKINHQRKNTSSKNFLIYCKFSFHLCCNSSVLHINKYTFVKKNQTNFQCLICHKAFKKS